MKPGEQLAAQFRLQPNAAFRISGRILGAAREQPLSTSLSTPGGDEVAARIAINIENGSFSCEDVPPGDYTISIAETGTEETKSAAAEVRVRDRDVTGVTLEMHSSPEVTFELEGAIGTGQLQQFAVLELHMRNTTSNDAEGKTIPLSTGGPLKKEVLAPGRYDVVARTFGGYVQSVTSGETDVLVSGLLVSGGVTPAPVKVKVDPGGGMINFRSTGGDRAGDRDQTPRYELIVGPVAGPWTPMEFEGDRRQGQLGLQVAPGEYYVVRLTDPEAEYRDKTRILGDLAKAKRVKVAEGQVIEVELEPGGGKP